MKHWQQMTQEELKKYVPDPDGEIERLQEQLKEANDCINSAQISLRGYMLKINEYKKKWSVK